MAPPSSNCPIKDGSDSEDSLDAELDQLEDTLDEEELETVAVHKPSIHNVHHNKENGFSDTLYKSKQKMSSTNNRRVFQIVNK
jgi:hypothetical protein